MVQIVLDRPRHCAVAPGASARLHSFFVFPPFFYLSLARTRCSFFDDLQRFVPASQLVHLAFSPDSKRLMVQAGAPDWVLTCWQWSLGKLMCWSRHLPISYSGQATSDDRIAQVSVNPWKPELIASTGPKVSQLGGRE